TLGCMGRALYTTRNIGHFGLGSECYCHFTSPIRRYPDLIVHRQLRWVLRGKQGDMPHSHEGLDILAVHCSEQGSAAEGLERSVVDSAMVFISRDGSWEGVQPGQVNGITKGSVFLSLPRGLEARVASSDVPGGPYDVDEYDSMLFVGSASRTEVQEEVTAKNWRELYNEARGEVVRVRLRLGDEVPVTIAGRDYVDGRVAAKLGE
ncbi:MAG TPA: RNB domain-containing ribonuclease, partial [Candidatus Thermoplasmatota archaeon]|nr:RNB domain-containing ribonuclease [Candidatus Thermoplasmatota archaeon]